MKIIFIDELPQWITSSDTAAAFAVTFFPILADIYNEDILYKAIIFYIQ